MILRRRGDTFESVIREHLGGALFATEGQVDRYFPIARLNKRTNEFQFIDCVIERGDNFELPASDEEIARLNAMWQFVMSHEGKHACLADRIQAHIRTAPEREAAALQRANLLEAHRTLGRYGI